MSNPLEMLEVVDDNDDVVGLENREKIHKEGLLHREIHLWFLTPNGEIVFQRRAKDKDTYPDKLDATVGGHVEPGMSYLQTAVKECKEETGLDVDGRKLFFLAKMRSKSFDRVRKLTNNAIRCQYVYLFKGGLSDLQVEKGKATGFEIWKIDILPRLSQEDKDRFICLILSAEMLDLFERAKKQLLR